MRRSSQMFLAVVGSSEALRRSVICGVDNPGYGSRHYVARRSRRRRRSRHASADSNSVGNDDDGARGSHQGGVNGSKFMSLSVGSLEEESPTLQKNRLFSRFAHLSPSIGRKWKSRDALDCSSATVETQVVEAVALNVVSNGCDDDVVAVVDAEEEMAVGIGARSEDILVPESNAKLLLASLKDGGSGKEKDEELAFGIDVIPMDEILY